MMCFATSKSTSIFSHLTVRSAKIYIQNNQPTNFLKSDDSATVHRSFFPSLPSGGHTW